MKLTIDLEILIIFSIEYFKSIIKRCQLSTQLKKDMDSTILLLTLLLIIDSTSSWEFCKPDIKSKICKDKGETHIVCDSLKAISEKTHQAETFLAHVPLTRLVKECFINWHNYYRHRVAGGKAKNIKNSKNFPKSSRMRTLIWDRELAFISHHRTKLVAMGKDTCHATQRFHHAGQNIAVKVMKANNKPVLDVITKAIAEWFNEKDNVDDPEKMGKGNKEDSTTTEPAKDDAKSDKKPDDVTTKPTESATGTEKADNANTDSATNLDTTEGVETTENAADSDLPKSDDAETTEQVTEEAKEGEAKEEAKKFISNLADGEPEGESETASEGESESDKDNPTTESEKDASGEEATSENVTTNELDTTTNAENLKTDSSAPGTTKKAATTTKPDKEKKTDKPEASSSTTSDFFTTMVSDRVSRLGCAVALGSNCEDDASVKHKFCYYVACTYDYDNTGLIYKITTSEAASECSRWGGKKSKKFKNLCENTGKIFDYTKED